MRLPDLLEGIGRPVAYYPRLRQMAGSTNAALLLCQLIYWQGKEQAGDGWIYKRAKPYPEDAVLGSVHEQNIAKETGLTYEEELNARRLLKARGLIQERYERLEHRLYFKVNIEAVKNGWKGLSPRLEGNNDQVGRQSLPGRTALPTSLIGTYIDYTETTAESPAAASEQLPQPHAPETATQEPDRIPNTPVEAMAHPDLQLFREVCGRIPGSIHYETVIMTMRHFRASKGDAQAVEYLRPFWLAWSSRRRRSDGQPYDPSSLTWLTEWAINDTIPTEIGDTHANLRTSSTHQQATSAADLEAARLINERRARKGRNEL